MKAPLKRLFPLLIILSFALPLHAQETAKIIRVVDGDTLKINYMGKQESIRLIGIDTPESRVNPRAKRESQRSGEDLKTILAMGKEATQFVNTLVKSGNKVSIEFDIEKRDKFVRTGVRSILFA